MADKVILSAEPRIGVYFQHSRREAVCELIGFTILFMILFSLMGIVILLFQSIAHGIQHVDLLDISYELMYMALIGSFAGPVFFVLSQIRTIEFRKESVSVLSRRNSRGWDRKEVSKIIITRFSKHDARVEVFANPTQNPSDNVNFFGKLSSHRNIDNAIKELAKFYPVEVTESYKTSEES